MAFMGGSVTLDIRLSRPNKTYRRNDLVSGSIIVNSSSEVKHDGIAVAMEGTIGMQMENKNVLMETFSSSIKPTQTVFTSLEMAKPGKLRAGTTEIPFEIKLTPLTGKILYETYHGVYITIQYHIRTEMRRSLLNKDLMKSIEFVVEVPEPSELDDKPLQFNISPESLRNVADISSLPRFLVKGFLQSGAFRVDKPLTGELIVERSDIPIKSIELQLVRLETCGPSEGFAKEATEIQNIQIGDGDVCRNIPIPLYMIFPRLFTCPTNITSNFKIEFELNLIVIFEDDHLVTENFPIKLVRPLN